MSRSRASYAPTTRLYLSECASTAWRALFAAYALDLPPRAAFEPKSFSSENLVLRLLSTQPAERTTGPGRTF